MTPSQTNDTALKNQTLVPFAEWPNLTYGARFLPDAFVLDFSFDPSPYFSDEGLVLDEEKVAMDQNPYWNMISLFSHGPRLLLIVPDVAAWDAAHHLHSFLKNVLDAFDMMLFHGVKPEVITISISLPSAALSSNLKGLRPLALYLWFGKYMPDSMGPFPRKLNPDFEIPFRDTSDEAIGEWLKRYESIVTDVKVGFSTLNGKKTLWLVPFRTIGTGCTTGTPALFGLRPISATSVSRNDIPVRQYQSGQSLWSADAVTQKRSVKDVDLNALAMSFTEAVDRHPSDALNALKQDFASQRARQELASLFTDTGHQNLLAQAQWWLQWRLETKSSRANNLLAVLVAEFGGIEAPESVGLHTELIPDDKNQVPDMWQGFINFYKGKVYFISACSADVDERTGKNSLPLAGRLRVVGANNPFYQEGEIRLYHPVILPQQDAPLINTNIPVLLKTLPAPAIILQQQALASGTDAAADEMEKLFESRLWDYNITYDRQSAVQDTLIVQLEMGNTGMQLLKAGSQPDLLDTLLEFSEVYPQLRTDLEKEEVMQQAVESFEWLVMNVSYAWMNRARLMKTKQQISYRINETEGDGGILMVTITGAEEPGMPQLLPHYEGHTGERTGNNWKFRSNTTQSYLHFIDRNWHLRSLVFEKLDVLLVENARAALSLERNLLPADGKLPNPDFALRTGFTELNAVVPFLPIDEAINISGFGNTIAEKVEKFFDHLFKGTHGHSFRLNVSYGYETIPGSGIPVKMPVIILPKEPYTSELAANVATAINDWKQQYLPEETHAGAFFELDLTVFGILEQRGILRIKGLIKMD